MDRQPRSERSGVGTASDVSPRGRPGLRRTTIADGRLDLAPPPPVRTPVSSAPAHELLRRRGVVIAPHRGYAGGAATGHDLDGLVVPASTAVPLVLTLDDSAHRPVAFAHGAHAEHRALPGPCAPLYLEVWLAPVAARRALGVPMHHLDGATADLGELSGRPGRTLAERVREATDWATRYALVDEFLLDAWQNGPDAPAEVRRAWQLLVSHRGTVPIAAVAHEVGWSHKHLITRFHEWIGISPKKAARILRFESLRRTLAAGPSAAWSDLAARHGYADQAHLVRETRVLTGSTPTQLI